MPQMTLPQHPQALAAMRPPPMAMPGGPRNESAPLGHPGQLGPRRSGGAPPPSNTLPAFPGGQNPGDYAQPAPFNPFLAGYGGLQTPGGMASPMLSRVPMGGFDLAPQAQHPARLNPYMSR